MSAAGQTRHCSNGFFLVLALSLWLNSAPVLHIFLENRMSNEVVIVSGARTPMGGLQGSLSAVPAPELGATAIAAAVERANLKNDEVEEVIMGNVLSANLGQGPARQAALKAGLVEGTGCVTLNKLCGSGMQAAVYAINAIASGENNVVVAGGMESMSQAPYIVDGARAGLRMGHKNIMDHMFRDGLEDAATGRAMGTFAQETADENDITREAMDAYAIESLNRAQRAIEEGLNNDEMAPVTVKTRKGETTVTFDEQPGNANIEKIPSLRPAFAKDGTITAANSSSISDGASALVFMSKAEAEKRGQAPLANVVAYTRQSQEPARFTTAPVGAIEKLLAKTGWDKDSVDLWEINEAFAMVTMLPMIKLGIPHEKVNIYGGACAQGHPIGSTGSRIIVTLMYAMQQKGVKRGIAALCIGGGEALAIALENPNA
jgi:acetyl-CoA C-acetyltransferase